MQSVFLSFKKVTQKGIVKGKLKEQCFNSTSCQLHWFFPQWSKNKSIQCNWIIIHVIRDIISLILFSRAFLMCNRCQHILWKITTGHTPNCTFMVSNEYSMKVNIGKWKYLFIYNFKSIRRIVHRIPIIKITAIMKLYVLLHQNQPRSMIGSTKIRSYR